MVDSLVLTFNCLRIKSFIRCAVYRFLSIHFQVSEEYVAIGNIKDIRSFSLLPTETAASFHTLFSFVIQLRALDIFLQLLYYSFHFVRGEY